jgi:hypothetical protein
LIATEEMQLKASSSSSFFFNLSTTTTTNLTKFEEEKTVNLITATNYSKLQIGCKPILCLQATFMQLEVFFFILSTATTITPTKADPKN